MRISSYQRRLNDISELEDDISELQDHVYLLEHQIEKKDSSIEYYQDYVKSLRIREQKQKDDSNRYVFVGGVKIDLKPATPMKFITEISNLGESMIMRYMPKHGKPNKQYQAAWTNILLQCPVEIIEKFDTRRCQKVIWREI